MLFACVQTRAQQYGTLKISPVSTFNMFREPSYISAFGGFGNIEPLMFEADIIPYYMLSLNNNARWGIELSPRIILRMYNKESYPVRTPSFMPRATFFYQIKDSKDYKRNWITYFTWYHHSNGQDGSFYNADSSSINTLSGNFSTNFLETGIFISRPDKKIPFMINYFKFYTNYCYKLDNDLRTIYGRFRTFIDYQSLFNISKILNSFNVSSLNSVHKSYLMQSYRFGWITGSLGNVKSFDSKRFIFRYMLSYKPSFFDDVTLFIQYYHGQDYYNIYFYRTLSVLRFGIAAKTSIFN